MCQAIARGLVVPWNVESSWTRDQTRVPSTARQILNHWTTNGSSSLSFLAQLEEDVVILSPVP